jgi:hypothetical protein
VCVWLATTRNGSSITDIPMCITKLQLVGDGHQGLVYTSNFFDFLSWQKHRNSRIFVEIWIKMWIFRWGEWNSRKQYFQSPWFFLKFHEFGQNLNMMGTFLTLDGPLFEDSWTLTLISSQTLLFRCLMISKCLKCKLMAKSIHCETNLHIKPN